MGAHSNISVTSQGGRGITNEKVLAELSQLTRDTAEGGILI